jgi:hypothetical protein
MIETLFTDVLNPEHELYLSAHLTDRDSLHESLSAYDSPTGRPGKSIGLMVGIQILKHRYNGSEEQTMKMLHENAY